MTKLLFQDALLDCFASKMEKYCLENNIPFKICLSLMLRDILFIDDLHLNINVASPSKQWIKDL